MKIVQISDTHLTAAGGPTEESFRLLADHLNTTVRPDLVVHSGDIQVLHPDDAGDREHSRQLLDLVDAPLLVIPGNHDVGMPGNNAWAGLVVTDERIAAHESVFGPGHWRHDIDTVTVIGINSELLGSNLQREADQWRWLQQTLEDIGRDRPVLLFLHKPLWAVSEVPTDHQLDVGPVARDRLLSLLGEVDLRAVGSGHLHCHRQTARGAALEVWAPATAFLASDGESLPETRQELGYIEYDVTDADVTASFCAVPGLAQRTQHDVPEIAKAIEAMTAAV
ncbi:metallophosphoesterase [Gordonia sp. CPCC 206044]|uniref:metallophosphoesterase family protein n=1 Tax=Gordonia sp. CPCC 206044 TaxID=3140793 RepID=UPI003AF3620C